MFLTSTKPLSDGSHELEAPFPKVWRLAREEGLSDVTYGSWWFVYESRADYEEGLD